MLAITSDMMDMTEFSKKEIPDILLQKDFNHLLLQWIKTR